MQIFQPPAWSVILFVLICFFIWEITFIKNEVWDGFFLVLCSLIQRGTDHPDDYPALHSRIFFLTLTLTAFFVFTSFTAILTSFMTFQPELAEIQNFQDILDRGLNFAVRKNSLTYTYMATFPPSTTGGKLYQFLQDNPKYLIAQYSDVNTLLEEDPLLIYFGPHTVRLELQNADATISLQNSFQDTLTKNTAFSFQKNSEIRPVISFHIHKMFQSGLMDHLMKKWFEKPSDDENLDGGVSEAHSVGYQQVSALLVILVLGIILAFIVLIMEKCKLL